MFLASAFFQLGALLLSLRQFFFTSTNCSPQTSRFCCVLLGFLLQSVQPLLHVYDTVPELLQGGEFKRRRGSSFCWSFLSCRLTQAGDSAGGTVGKSFVPFSE